MQLKGKTILILSPQAWGKMFLSKHHYALELAKYGNRVYFLNPPDQEGKRAGGSIEVQATTTPGLFLIDHALFFPYWLKFKARGIFHALMKFHVNRVVDKIGDIDIVWSFDLGNLYPFRLFHKKLYRIFHPVDEPLNRDAIDSADGANVIFSVTHEILDKYKAFPARRHFINHGASEEFIGDTVTSFRKNNPVTVGFSGNLLRPDIDREILLEIVRTHTACIFEFWGSYTMAQTNIGGRVDDATEIFIKSLMQLKNVTLYGAITPRELAVSIRRMDAFLICYDVQRDQSKGTNYHKVMEYLGSGKVIISNNITTYKDQKELVSMIDNRNHNHDLKDLFGQVIGALEDFNSVEMQNKRIEFARENTYPRQIARIEQQLNE